MNSQMIGATHAQSTAKRAATVDAYQQGTRFALPATTNGGERSINEYDLRLTELSSLSGSKIDLVEVLHFVHVEQSSWSSGANSALYKSISSRFARLGTKENIKWARLDNDVEAVYIADVTRARVASEIDEVAGRWNRIAPPKECFLDR